MIRADAAPVEYITPAFERDKVAAVIGVEGDIFTWQEEESPYRLIADRLGNKARMAVDESVALFTWLGLCGVLDDARLNGGGALINRLRRREDRLRTRVDAIRQGHHARSAAPRVEEPEGWCSRQRGRSFHRS